jgi:uncharacterized hydrophobic protein (TIGR00271 family)
MLHLRVFGTEATIAQAARELEALAGCRHVVRGGDGTSQTAVVTADLTTDAADAALAQVRRLGVPSADIDLLRLDSIGPSASPRPFGSVVWADLLSQAGANARPLARYLILMACAGIIAGLGVIYDNGILVVGAMAISPDLLPITATATALIVRRWRLAGHALVALVVGLGCAGLVAAAMTFLLRAADQLPKGFHVGDSPLLTGMSTVNASTVLVAGAAGVAGMLALETRASSAVGVAISVTTIPASAYVGVALGVREASRVEGALLVLAVNVAMLVAGGCLVLAAQREVAPRIARGRPEPGPLRRAAERSGRRST